LNVLSHPCFFRAHDLLQTTRDPDPLRSDHLWTEPLRHDARTRQCPSSRKRKSKASFLSSILPSDVTHLSASSWELGTRSQAILELNASSYSVLTPKTSLPPPQFLQPSRSDALQPFFALARDVVANRGTSNGNITGSQPLIQDGSAADPSSMGVPVLVAGWLGLNDRDYAGAAKDQLDFLLYKVPRTKDGAISHRVSEVQLWSVSCFCDVYLILSLSRRSDFVYMVPPFLAYSGVIAQNQTLLVEAYNQIKLYRSYLRDSHAKNLWKHIVLGSGGANSTPNDAGYWATGEPTHRRHDSESL